MSEDPEPTPGEPGVGARGEESRPDRDQEYPGRPDGSEGAEGGEDVPVQIVPLGIPTSAEEWRAMKSRAEEPDDAPPGP